MLEKLLKEELLELLNAYNRYIQDNAENNAEFGHSWFPVCISEFYQNDFEYWR